MKQVTSSGELKIEVLHRSSRPFVPLMNKWRVSLADGWKGVKIEGSHALWRENKEKIAKPPNGPADSLESGRRHLGTATYFEYTRYQGQGLLATDQFQKPD